MTKPKMTQYTNEPYLRAEHLLRDGNYLKPTLKVIDVLEGAPLTRKLKPYAGIALKFENQAKVLGLGQTNESLMACVCQDATPSSWIGRSIVIEVREVRSPRGGTEPAIRIMPQEACSMRGGLFRELGNPIPRKVEAK